MTDDRDCRKPDRPNAVGRNIWLPATAAEVEQLKAAAARRYWGLGRYLKHVSLAHARREAAKLSKTGAASLENHKIGPL